MNNINTMSNILQPACFSKFNCTGGDCKNSCCTEKWDVFLEEPIYKKYKKVINSEMANRLKKSVKKIRSGASERKYGRIDMSSGQCPLLDRDKLCSVYKNLGPEYMGNICRVYPRHISKVEGDISRTLSVSCEEVAKLILTDRNVMEFETVSENISKTIYINEYDRLDSNSWKKYHVEYREAFITILQCRKYTLNNRLIILGMMCEQLDDAIKEDSLDSIPNILGAFLCGLDGDIFDGISKDIEVRLDMQHTTYVELLRYNIALRKLTEGLIHNFIASTNALALNEKFSDTVKDKIIEGNNKYNKFVEKNSHVLENYLVNNIILNTIPTVEESLMDGLFNLLVRYAYVKLFVAGYSYDRLSEDSIVDLLRRFEKSLGHSRMIKKAVEIISGSGQLTLEKALFIIHN